MKDLDIYIKLFLSLIIFFTSTSCTQLVVGGSASGGIILVQEKCKASNKGYNNKNKNRRSFLF